MGHDANSQASRTGDPFLSGDLEADQLMLDYPVTRGLLFPDMVGPVLLMRRKVYPGDIEDWYYAGSAHPNTGTIVNANGVTHNASSGYEYTALRAFGNGFVGRIREPIRVDFDGAGAIITPALPTWPRDLRVAPAAGGTFNIYWLYVPWGESNPPADFQVFEGTTPATIDYGTPLGTITHDGSQEQYTFTTGAYTDGTKHSFAVRARNSGGVAELNEFASDVLAAEDSTPAAATIASAAVRSQGGRI